MRKKVRKTKKNCRVSDVPQHLGALFTVFRSFFYLIGSGVPRAVHLLFQEDGVRGERRADVHHEDDLVDVPTHVRHRAVRCARGRRTGSRRPSSAE